MAKILCVEDESTIRMLISEALSDVGHEVFEAADGAAGLEQILRHAPDLVICDSLMPEKTGFELFQEIRDRYPQHREVPFVFLSAHADQTNIDEGLSLGAAAYLTKPIDLDLLIETMDRALQSQPDQPSSMRASGGTG